MSIFVSRGGNCGSVLHHHMCTRCKVRFYEGEEHVCGPVVFKRVDTYEPYPEKATYRAKCPTCNVAVDLTTNAEYVRRYAVEPVPANAPAIWFIADAMNDGPEKRAQNAAADRHETRMRDDALRELERGGCAHARSVR